MRIVLDSHLRTPPSANVISGASPTLIFGARGASTQRRRALLARHAGVRLVEPSREGVSLREVLSELRAAGVETLLVEGGARVLTSLLLLGQVDRVIIALAPKILGAGTEAIGDLGTTSVAQGMRLIGRQVTKVGEDLVIAGDLDGASRAGTAGAGDAGVAAG